MESKANKLWKVGPDSELDTKVLVYEGEFKYKLQDSDLTLNFSTKPDFESMLGYSGDVYFRQFSRDINNWRKQHKLELTEQIRVFLPASYHLELKPFEEQIKERCVADQVFYNSHPSNILIEYKGEIYTI